MAQTFRGRRRQEPDVYAEELALSDRADLRAQWEAVRPRVQRTLKALGPTGTPWLLWSLRARAKLERAVKDGIPAMRRQLGS